jgi:hypothetical protein
MENFVGRKIKKGWLMKPKALAGSKVGKGGLKPVATVRAGAPGTPQKKGGKAA